MSTVELADIRIRAALPLHLYLSKHSHLFLRLVADGSVCGDTTGVDGDLAGGVWEFNGRLYAPRVRQSLNVGVLTGAKGPGTQVVSVTLNVAELLAREKACPNRHQYIVIFDSRAAIQLKLVVTCSIKLSSILGRVSQAVGNDHTIDRCSGNNESDFDPETMQLLSREDLESLYVKTNYVPDQNDSKARQLSLLGDSFLSLYRKNHGRADLERAISIHEESIQFTGLIHPQLAKYAHCFVMALLERFQQSGDDVDIERAISYSHVALRFTEELDTAKPLQLNILGIALGLRFQRFGSFSDLENSKTSTGDVSVNYSKLAIEWDDIVEAMRRIPRFEGFLKAKSFRQLAPAAHEGPVIILNVNDAHCDAIALISDDSIERKVSAVHIPLERFSHEKSKKLFHILAEILSSAGVRERSDRKTGRVQSQADGETKFKAILHILWQDVTELKRPSIWWCVTGLLAFLPIHAAGLYDTKEPGHKISDYVVSSYTPTLTAILGLSDPTVQGDFQVLTVAQASAPGAQPIPKTEEEVQIIHGLTAGVRRVKLMGKDATVERVQKEMAQSNWIHLACHGKQNSDNPMESGFPLHDKMLKLSEIVRMSLPKADFAFLSACQTAMGDERVTEESVHSAAGMLLSGCRGVIATTWSICDEDGPKIAEDVYGRIFKDGKPNKKEVAYALHEAVKRLRESGAQCTSWVPFIHIGR